MKKIITTLLLVLSVLASHIEAARNISVKMPIKVLTRKIERQKRIIAGQKMLVQENNKKIKHEKMAHKAPPGQGGEFFAIGVMTGIIGAAAGALYVLDQTI